MTTREPVWDRHDRSRRFIRTAFSWDQEPDDVRLMDAASRIRIDLRLGGDSQRSPTSHLLVLAAANMLLRLPFRTTFSIPVSQAIDLVPPPYQGKNLGAAISCLADALGVQERFALSPSSGGVSLVIQGFGEPLVLEIGVEGWLAVVRSRPVTAEVEGNSIAAHGAATMAVAESLREWARAAARLGAAPGKRFAWDTKPTEDSVLNFWRPGTNENGPTVSGIELPPIDWVGAGAVTQSATAVLAAIPGMRFSGRVFDPKEIDEPDLNRSIWSFDEDIGKPKPLAVTSRLPAAIGDLVGRSGHYPDSAGDPLLWVVCGADDVAVRPACQDLWPERFIVVATEGSRAQVSCHSQDSEHFCGGCFSVAPSSSGPVPTIAPTSVMAGVLGAAALCKLAMGSAVAPLTDILTLRLDSSYGLKEESPAANPECRICASRRKASAAD